MAVTATGGSKKAGVVLPVKTDATGSYVEEDFTGTDLIVGRQYSLKSAEVDHHEDGSGRWWAEE